MTQDEVTGLRDIIRHDVLMDAKALEKLTELRVFLLHPIKDSTHQQVRDAAYEIITEVEGAINSKLSDAKPGAAAGVGVVALADQLGRYVEYIRNTKRVPLPTAIFDEDWEPIGPRLRHDLKNAGLIIETDGGLTLLRTDAQS